MLKELLNLLGPFIAQVIQLLYIGLSIILMYFGWRLFGYPGLFGMIALSMLLVFPTHQLMRRFDTSRRKPMKVLLLNGLNSFRRLSTRK
jgi:hypothetical protein